MWRLHILNVRKFPPELVVNITLSKVKTALDTHMQGFVSPPYPYTYALCGPLVHVCPVLQNEASLVSTVTNNQCEMSQQQVARRTGWRMETWHREEPETES